jgi:U3 small nucleolar RNA-associated protein 5
VAKSLLPNFSPTIVDVEDIFRLQYHSLATPPRNYRQGTHTLRKCSPGIAPSLATMPAAVNARNRDRAPPAKKAKLAQSPAPARQNGVNLKALAKGPSAQRPTAKTNGVKNARDQVDESTAVVGGGQHGDIDMEDAGKQVIEISSAEEESEDESSEEEDPTQPGADEAAPAVNGEGEQEDGLIQDGTVEAEDLSFGDRLRAHAQPVHVDVEGAFADNNMESQALAPTNSVPNASSLGTVLTQALRTNDSALFESCLRVIDVDAVYSTVERLPSPLVGTLLQKLAERLHKKPGRAGSESTFWTTISSRYTDLVM